MDKLRSWIYGSQGTNKDTINKSEGKELSHESQLNNASSSLVLVETANADPIVVEFFKEFPEPYRQKAIQRFSKREGLYRLDFFRKIAMGVEKDQAMRGVFLEDQREFEKLQWQHMEIDEEEAERRRLFFERDVPEWEKQALKVIPLQSWDTMRSKLFETSILALAGLLFAFSGLSYRKRFPQPKWKVVSACVGSFGACACCHVVAVHRLMDWEPFDKSSDDRVLIDKAEEEFTEFFNILKLYVQQVSSQR